MPFAGEHAPANSQVGTANDPLVKATLGEYKVATHSERFRDEVADLTTPLADLPEVINPDSIDFCIAIDGSRQETPVAEVGGRTVTVCHTRVGAVFIDLARRRELSKERFVNPSGLKTTVRSLQINYPMPGSLAQIDDLGPQDSWREATDRFLLRAFVTDEMYPGGTGEKISLADVLLMLHRSKIGSLDAVIVKQCPVCGENSDSFPMLVVPGGETAYCESCGDVVRFSDSLGMNSVFTEDRRENAVNTLMNATERLAMIGLVELLRRRDLVLLARTLIVADGPLAAIHPIDGLAKPILAYLDALAAEVEGTTGRPLMIVGVEKGGDFVKHGQWIQDAIEPGSVMRLSTDYVNARIVNRRHGRSAYGAGHMYGRRFFYRRNDGGLLTITVPPKPGVAPWSYDDASEAIASYPTLGPVLRLLESLKSSKFPDAILPLTEAHGVASIGLGQAATVLTAMSQEALGVEQNTRLRARMA
jgi:hypothetical protein